MKKHIKPLFFLIPHGKGKGFFRAGFDAFTATDALGTVGCFGWIHVHRADTGTFSAVNAGILITMHPEEADLLE